MNILVDILSLIISMKYFNHIYYFSIIMSFILRFYFIIQHLNNYYVLFKNDCIFYLAIED